MSSKFPGGLITKSPAATVGPSGDYSDGGSAPGIWSLDQAMALRKAGLWPTRSKEKYLWTWGVNSASQLGDGTVINRSSPVQIGGLATWSKISGGNNHSMALKTDGTMWAWGYSDQGGLGDNSRVYRSSPIQVGALTTWSSIASGQYYSMALKTDGTMWTWGYNHVSQLGDNTAILRSSPVQIGALTTWSSIAGGQYHSMALKTDGTMWSWGANNYGRLGLNDVIYRSSPVQIGAGTTWSKITNSHSGTHSRAIKTDGTMWSWGINNYGMLGDNTVIDRSSPIQIGALTTWSSIANGQNYAVALKTDGTMWAWGRNDNGPSLGDNTIINRSSPVQIGALTTWSSIAGGGLWCMALKTDGTIWSWGRNVEGQLGQTNVIFRSSPVQIGAEIYGWSLASGGTYHFTAIKTNGTMWTWGKNDSGSLGDNSTIPRSSPVQIGSLATWSKISAGITHTMAIKTDGTMWTWGNAAEGRLGQNSSTISKSSPVQIGSLTTWSEVDGGEGHSMAVKTDGTMWLWGKNNYGQIGDNTVVYRSSPVQIGSLTTWSKISSGTGHSLAIKTDGTMWTWGNGSGGKLGITLNVTKSSPTQVGALTSWLKISGANGHSMALKVDGTLWLWGGGNGYGSLGDNTVVYKSSPVQIGALATWSHIAAGGKDFSAAIETDGTWYSWGRNDNGQLGDNTVTRRSSPVQIGSTPTAQTASWAKISAGLAFGMAIAAV